MKIIAACTQEQQHMVMVKMESFHGSMLVLGLVLVLDSVFVLALALELACLLKPTKAPLATLEDGCSNCCFIFKLKSSLLFVHLPLNPKTPNLIFVHIPLDPEARG